MFEASVARVIWSLRLNPVHILQALNADKELIRQLSMPARYHCYKNIRSFFEDLHGDIVAQYADLWKDAANYMEHPVINEISLRMSFYAYRMDEYERYKKYYKEYRRTKHLVSIEQYAPWLHRYYMVVSFAVRVLYVIDAIKAIPTTNEFLKRNLSIQKTIRNFMSEPTEKEYVILGMLLGFTNTVLLKRLTWKNAPDGSKKAHVWFVFLDFGWEIDIAYNNIVEAVETNRIFFVINQHPLENGLSRFVSKKNEQGRLSVPLVQKGTFGLGNFGESEQAEMLEICDMIEKHLPEDCPTIEELLWCYGDVMIPVRGDFI